MGQGGLLRLMCPVQPSLAQTHIGASAQHPYTKPPKGALYWAQGRYYIWK